MAAEKNAALHARYKVALARVLLRKQTPRGTRPVPAELRTGKTPAATNKNVLPRGASSASLDVARLLVLTTMLQAPDLPQGAKGGTEADKLADEILAMGDKVPFDVRAQALAVKNLYTRALRVYVGGLRDKGLLAPNHANAILALINNHPTFRRPESRSDPDPLQAEKNYAAGLSFYAAKKYARAEREFLAAVENDNGDARYYYFLGLSRLAQGNREGYEDFDQAAQLERLGRPDRAAVSKALERVQGPMRKALNAVRNRPVRETAK
jgi:tetratricopeptide (TPR) repeat protein